MANFSIAYNIVAGHEGGYQNHPNDQGNYNSLGELVGTNWGINAKVYEDTLGFPPTEGDMRLMSIDTAQQIYRQRYWNRIQGDLIGDQSLANIFFDGHVNHGTTGIKIMQRILGVADDGIVGPITLGELNNQRAASVYNLYKQARIDFYNFLANNRPGLDVFLSGWLIRINSFNDYPNEQIDFPIDVIDPSDPAPGEGDRKSFGLFPVIIFSLLGLVVFNR